MLFLFPKRRSVNTADNSVLLITSAVHFLHSLSHCKYFGYSICTLKLKLTLYYYIEREIAILQLKYSVILMKIHFVVKYTATRI